MSRPGTKKTHRVQNQAFPTWLPCLRREWVYMDISCVSSYYDWENILLGLAVTFWSFQWLHTLKSRRADWLWLAIRQRVFVYQGLGKSGLWVRLSAVAAYWRWFSYLLALIDLTALWCVILLVQSVGWTGHRGQAPFIFVISAPDITRPVQDCMKSTVPCYLSWVMC